MSEECVQSDDTPGKPKLICSEIWGGIQDLDRDVNTDGVDASLYSSSCDGGKGGDIYYVGACKGCMLTRVAVADVVGHGKTVSEVSQYMYDSLKEHICDPDSGKILHELNQRACRQGLQAMTTAAVVAYSGMSAEIHLSSAGHPPVLFKQANEKTWSVPARDSRSSEGDRQGVNLPLAVGEDAVYAQQSIRARSGDRLFIYTDGVTEAPSRAGELFGVHRLTEVLDAHADAPLSGLKSAVLEALHRHTGNGLTHDDVTLVAIAVR